MMIDRADPAWRLRLALAWLAALETRNVDVILELRRAAESDPEAMAIIEQAADGMERIKEEARP